MKDHVNMCLTSLAMLGADYDADRDGSPRKFELHRMYGEWTAAWRNGYHDTHALVGKGYEPFEAMSALIDLLLADGKVVAA